MTDRCSHRNTRDCVACALFIRNLNVRTDGLELVRPGIYQDPVTAEEFCVTANGLLRPYVPPNFPAAPPKAKRKAGEVYIFNGKKVKSDKSGQLRKCCHVGACTKHANYPDEKGKANTLCADCARAAGAWKAQNPCRNHPQIQACYADEKGKANKLCAECARAAGAWKPINPCRNHPRIQSKYPDEEGKANKLCADCARVAGTWKLKNPCRDHPMLQSHYPDEKGKANKLCADCARAAGTWTAQHPCRYHRCIEASYPDEKGKANQLCADCARAAGTWTAQNPCRYHPRIEASYADEKGKANQLCADCARATGTWTAQNPCRNHPRIQSKYPDEEGNVNKLCADCAVAAGTHFASVPGASKVACECFDRLEAQLGYKIPHEHYCRDAEGNPRIIGKEARGLIPGSHARPDGFVPDRNEVWLFHGNYYHGYPEDHQKHDSVCVGGQSSVELHRATLEQMACYKAHGFVVKYIWEHEYAKTTKAKCPSRVMEVVSTF